MKLHVHVYSNQLPKFMDDSVQHNWICRECLNLLKNCERERAIFQDTLPARIIYGTLYMLSVN